MWSLSTQVTQDFKDWLVSLLEEPFPLQSTTASTADLGSTSLSLYTSNQSTSKSISHHLSV